jgi:hypothetical protein
MLNDKLRFPLWTECASYIPYPSGTRLSVSPPPGFPFPEVKQTRDETSREVMK